MHPWDWAGLLLGLGVVALAIGDLWITIFHKDFEGPIAKGIQNGIWRLIILVARRISRGRRLLVSMAGPVMVFSTLAAWLSLYLLGFAIAVWPQLHDQFLTEQSIDPTRLGFIDALYYSGVTGTTLGYGDIVPESGLFKVLAFVQSGFGFVILTATITYLLGIIGGSAQRNSLAVRVFSQTQGSGDGVEIVAASLATEDVADLRRRLDALSEAVHSLQEVFHQFPVLDIYFRSREPNHDPEPMLRALVEAAITAQLLAEDPRYHSMKRAAQELDNALVQVMLVTGRQYFPDDDHQRLLHPQPSAEDGAHVEDLHRRLQAAVPMPVEPTGIDAALTLAFRLRVFMTALDAVTAWSVIQPHPGRRHEPAAAEGEGAGD